MLLQLHEKSHKNFTLQFLRKLEKPHFQSISDTFRLKNLTRFFPKNHLNQFENFVLL